jgi:hypothetical protein
LIIFDASALVSAALKADSIPERALLRAEEVDVFALSAAVDGEIAGVLNRPRFARAIPLARRERVLEILRHAAVWFEPTVRVTDRRDPKDNKYLELALAAGAETIVSGDDDLLVLDPWRGVRIVRPADYLARDLIPSLAFRLAGAGMKVAVVERHLVGGTCVNTGCTRPRPW